MYNTNYKCVKPLTLWYDGPDGKKKPSGRAAAAYGSGPQKIPKSKKKQRR